MMVRFLSLNFLLLFIYSSQLIIDGAPEQCGIVINDENEARECLNLESDNTAPLPVVLKTQPDSEFVCKNRTAPPYVFYCTVHGNNLLWDFNNNLDNLVTSFQPLNNVGLTKNKTYNESGLEYNVTAVLIWVSKRIEDNNVSIPICISVLTVDPLSESNFDVIPSFTVSCLTHCQASLNHTQTCQSKRLTVAATPSKPREVMGNITSTPEVGGSIASVNWLPPENFDKTSIDYYELKMVQNGSNTNTFRIDSAASLPYYFKVSEGNYTVDLSVTAVDVCGQRSEPSDPVPINVTSGSVPDPTIGKQEQPQDKVIGLAVPFSIALAILVILIIVVIVLKKDTIKEYIVNNYSKNSTQNYSDHELKA